MKRIWLPGLAGLLGLALLSGSSFGDDQPTATKKRDRHRHTANKPVAPEGAKTETSAHQDKQAARTHLPAGFGKVNLTGEQHQKAMGVMDRYAAQIKQLEAQIHDLKAKRDGELSALLNDTQKKSLADARTNAQKARADKKATAAKTVAVGGGKLKINPDELKALHDQAEKNLGKGNPHAAVKSSAHRKHGKAKKTENGEAKDQGKTPASEPANQTEKKSDNGQEKK